MSHTELEVTLDPSLGLGVDLAGGVDSPYEEDNNGIYVVRVEANGAAEKAGVKAGDRIVCVGSTDTENVKHEVAVEALREELQKEKPTLTLLRKSGSPTEPRRETLSLNDTTTGETSTDEQVVTTKADGAAAATDFSDSAMTPINTKGPGGFGCRLPQLVELIAERGTNGMERLHVHFGGIEGLAKKLLTDLAAGITATEDDIERRTSVFGTNTTPEVRPKTLLELMWEAFQDPILIILMVAAVLSVVLNITVEKDYDTGWIEGVAIVISCFIVVMVTAVNDLQKEKQFRELKAKQASQHLADVIRNGEPTQVLYTDLVVGDIVEVKGGLVLPADGVLIQANDVMTDESALTGESHDIKKDLVKNPWLLSGTSVKQGSGRMIVTCVGLFSEEGIIQKLITGVGIEETERLEALAKEGLTAAEQMEAEDAAAIIHRVDERQQENFDDLEPDVQDKLEKKESKKKSNKESILQKKLEKLAVQIGYFATFFAVLTIVELILAYTIDEYAIKKNDYDSHMWNEFVDYFITGITVLVVAIPEGLPLAVTISLAYSVKKMFRDHNLVRVLAACETMGNATTICSDKTGTLTKNRMTVVRSWVGGKKYDDVEEIKKEVTAPVLDDLAQGIAINSDYLSTYTINEADGLPVQQNNKTECACLQYADQIVSKTHKQYRKETPAEDFVKAYPFNSAKKRMETIIQLPNGTYRMFVKGASEIILSMSTHYADANGERQPITDDLREDIGDNVIVEFASQALRVICLAYRDFDTAQDWDNEEALLEDLTVACFVGIQDPVRDEVPGAVETCRDAGVVVRMVTGDNLITARAIAVNCNIITKDEANEDGRVMEGPVFRQRVTRADGSIDFEEMDKIWPQLRVLARCSPSDKYNLVKGLIRAGEVVAVTGDGTNDGPALSEADVGFAMGIAGTDVAKNASDIIITDDNFSSIVKAISWGRNVYDSISKFLVFQLTVNVVAVLVAFIGACALRTSPLRAVQLLWVNLIMDTFAALALATEQPTPDLLKRKPYGRNKALLSRIMIRQIGGHSIYQLAVILFLVFYGDKMFDIPNGGDLATGTPESPSQHFTIVFNTFVWMQIFNEINARVIHDDLYFETSSGRIIGGPLGALMRPFKGFFTNPIFVCVVLGTAVAQAIITEVGGQALFTEPLTAGQWGVCIAFGAFSLLWNVIIHFLLPWEWIPEWFEPGQYKELTPDRAAEVAEKDEEIELPEGGLDAPRTPSMSRATTMSRAATISGPMRHGTMSGEGTPVPQRRQTDSGLLWLRIGRRLRTQVRVAGAFRAAGNIARLRRRTSMLASRALGGPHGRAAPTYMHEHHADEKPPTPALAMWRTAVARLRSQLRVVRAFQSAVSRPPPAIEDREMRQFSSASELIPEQEDNANGSGEDKPDSDAADVVTI
ncbi:P-type ATPase [Salpingoeca rosetta]|uniref:Calcium-transporting ATPase n=1 Tax=Salpingoeca rosetta (strain ATCC 50818 / BSB-021) TaxID=946362 RepID=F2U641_SALR5|nr:P-type ATPase [Salpingoeca rosetta]EGD82982.1 P-type ATPase [Salpingoeca rosetta]|eukprot:XP_004995346.1 P-type ATPase [Salpingoeca rosetta]